MASVMNLFDVLSGDEGQQKAKGGSQQNATSAEGGGSKKKRSKKGNKGQANQGDGSTVKEKDPTPAADVPASSPSLAGPVTVSVATPDPSVSDGQADQDGGWIMTKSSHYDAARTGGNRKKDRKEDPRGAVVAVPAASAAGPADSAQSVGPTGGSQVAQSASLAAVTASPVSSEEAETAALENLARTKGSNSSTRLQVWHDWTVRAQTPGPQSAAWKKAFLRTRALEISVASCLRQPLIPPHSPSLQGLLTAFFPNAEAAQVMTQVTVDLAQATVADLGPTDPKLQASAEGAVTAAVAALKVVDSCWALQVISGKLADEAVQNELQKLNLKSTDIEQQLQHSSSGPEVSANPDDRSTSLKSLVEINEQRLKLLLPSGDGGQQSSRGAAAAAGAGDVAAEALRSIRQLTVDIVARKDVTSAKVSQEKKTVKAVPAKRVQAVPPATAAAASSASAATSNSEALLKLVAEIANEEDATLKLLEAAEAEVSRLRLAKLELESRRRAAEAQLQGLTTPLSSSSASAQQAASAGQSAEASAAAAAAAAAVDDHQLRCVRQLGVVHALEALLLRPPPTFGGQQGAQFGDSETEAVLAVITRAVVDHLNALVALLAAQSERLQSAAERLRFSSDKVKKLRAERQGHLDRGKTSLAATLVRPLQAVEDMFVKRKLELEDVLSSAEAVETGLQQPALRTAIALLPPLPGIHLLLHQIGHTLNQIRNDFKAIIDGLDGPIKSNSAVPSKSNEDNKAFEEPRRGGKGRGKVAEAKNEVEDLGNGHHESQPSDDKPKAHAPSVPVVNAWRTTPQVPRTELAASPFQVLAETTDE